MSVMIILFIIVLLIVAVPAAVVFGVIYLLKPDNKNGDQKVYPNPQVYTNPQPYTYRQVKDVKPKKKLPASAVMLLIGTAFIILSAITFITANWVNLEPVGRSLSLAGVAVLAFAICGVMKSVVKLDRTSGAFFITGTFMAVVSFICAGYYEFFGDWFAPDMNGAGLFFAVCSLIISVMMFVGAKIYKHIAYKYAGLSFVSAAILFMCIQASDNIEQFAVIIAVAQLIITAVIHIIKPQKNTFIEKPVTIMADITAIIFAFIAMMYVLFTSFEPTWYTFGVLGIIITQLFLYGIFKKQKWMFIFANILSLYTSLAIAFRMESLVGEPDSMAIFGMATAIVYIINKLYKNNLPACNVIAFIGMVIGSIVSLCATNNNTPLVSLGLNYIVPIFTEAVIAANCLNKSKTVQAVAGLALPFIPLFTALSIYERFSIYAIDGRVIEDSRILTTLVYGGLVLFFLVLTAAFSYMPKYAFDFYAHHPIRSYTAVYSLMTVSGIVLMSISGYSNIFFIPLALCMAHFLISHTLNCNITGVGSVIGILLIVRNTLKEFLGLNNSAEGMFLTHRYEILLYTMFGIFVALIALSRVIFKNGFAVKKDGKLFIDVLYISAWTAVIGLPSNSKITAKTIVFLFFMAIAVMLAGAVKKNTQKITANILLSFSAFAAAIAFMARPFLNPDSSVVSSKIALGIFVLLGVAYKFIWRENKEASKITSTIIFILSFAGLIIDGLVHSGAGNRIFVLAVTAGILVFSFFVKSKTWFTASSISLVIITAVSTWKYFDSAGWWIYLLAVGVIFIVIASVNEACKKKGETMKSTVEKTFSDWTW